MRIFSINTTICFLFCLGSFAQTQDAIKTLLDDPDLKTASLGIYAVDLNSGQIVVNHDHQRSLVPASVMKLITSSAALKRLGSDHRFTTTMGYTGTIEGNKLEGDLIVVGGGDPSLGVDNISGTDPVTSWVKALEELGVNEIAGNLIAVDTLFGEVQIPETWIWEDMGNYYATGSSGLSYKGNRVEVEFSTGKVNSPARVVNSGFFPGLTYSSSVVSSSDPRDKAYIFGAPGMNERVIRGTLPANRNSYTIEGSVPDPLTASAYRIKEDLIAAGVSIRGSAEILYKLPDGFQQIAAHQSPPLNRLIEFTNHESDNLFAEHLLRMLAVGAGQPGDYNSALAQLKAFLEVEGIDSRGFYPADGSGLSRFNGVTAVQLVEVLRAMWNSEDGESFQNSLPIIAEEGSLRNVGKGTAAAGNGWAKSGYMERVRSYAGYVRNSDEHMIAFALIANNFSCTASAMRKKWTEVIAELAR